MAALGIIRDGVSSTHADPLGKGPVLLLLLGKNLLDLECLLRRHDKSIAVVEGGVIGVIKGDELVWYNGGGDRSIDWNE